MASSLRGHGLPSFVRTVFAQQFHHVRTLALGRDAEGRALVLVPNVYRGAVRQQYFRNVHGAFLSRGEEGRLAVVGLHVDVSMVSKE